MTCFTTWWLSLALFGIAHASRHVERQASPAASSGTQSSRTSSLFSAPTVNSAPTANSSEFDFKQHFCRVWRHASTLADGKIWIDGGNTYVPKENTTFYNTPNGTGYERGMNTFLYSIGLSENFTNHDTLPYTTYPKPDYAPNSLIEHALWYSAATRKIYQLGGWFSINDNQSPVYVHMDDIPEASIWQFDVDTGSNWVKTDFKKNNTGSKVNRPGAAASCNAPTLNQSFIFEGYVQQRSDHDYVSFKPYADFQFIEGMLSLDTSGLTPSSDSSEALLNNITVPTYIGPRMNGAMVHVPVGEKGIVVQIGGQTTNNPTSYGVKIADANAGNSNVNMSFVDIYDVLTGYWFRQETFGNPEIPTGRSDICTVLVSAEDGSSHNIFVIAGVNSYNSVTTYEEWWVLSIPTFTWTKVFSRDRGRYGHTCHLVGENLVVVGGMETQSTENGGDVKYCESHMPAEIFSLPLNNYTGVFDAAGGRRAPPIPQAVVDTIGGDRYGKAYLTQPKVWSDLYLQYVLNPSLKRPAYTPTYALVPTGSATPTPSPKPPPKHKSTNAGAIAGGVVAGVVVLALVGVLAWCIARRRKATRAATTTTGPSAATPSAELPSYIETKQPATYEIAEAPPHYADPTELPTNKSDPDLNAMPTAKQRDDEIRAEAADNVSPMGSPRRPGRHAHTHSSSSANSLTGDTIAPARTSRFSEAPTPVSAPSPDLGRL